MGIALQATGRIDLAIVYYQVRVLKSMYKLLHAQCDCVLQKPVLGMAACLAVSQLAICVKV